MPSNLDRSSGQSLTLCFFAKNRTHHLTPGVVPLVRVVSVNRATCQAPVPRPTPTDRQIVNCRFVWNACNCWTPCGPLDK